MTRAGVATAAATLGPAAVAAARKSRRGRRFPHPKTPDEALALLKAGNRRYVKGKLRLNDYSPVGEDRASDQKPFAAIITCSDSRVSSTLIFDVERGNIFVSRVAGNSIDTATLGSTEYGVAVLGAKLIVVLAHSDCGAVKSAIAVANGDTTYPPERYGKIGDVVNQILPPIQAVPPPRQLDRCIDANVRAQADEIAAANPIIKPQIDAGKLKVVPAIYNIANGKVTFG